jgi:signal transduction histidine kinase
MLIGSIQIIDEALHYIDKDKDLEEHYYLLSYRAEVLYYEGLFNEAMRDLDLCDGIARQLEDSLLVANVLNLKGLLHENIQDSRKAMVFLRQAEKYFPAHPAARYPTSELHHIYGNMGSYMTNIGSLDSAEVNLDRSLALAISAGAARAIAVAYWSLGELELKKGDAGTARSRFERSYQESEKALDHDIGLDALVGAAQAAMTVGDRQAASAYLKKADAHLQAFRDGIGMVTQPDFFRNASQIYREMGALDQSISVLGQWHHIDSLISKRNIESALSTQAALLRSDADLAMERLQLQETALSLERVEFSRKVLLFGTIFGFIFLSFVYFSLRNKRKNEKLLADAELLRLRQERMIAELTIREQVGRDMHDDLGAGLSALKLKTEMAMRVEKDALHFNQMKGLSITAGELIESMRQIIWSMSEDQSSVEDLVVYASNYGRTYLADHGVSLTYGHSQSWPPLELSSAQRRNVFLILKEAFHNIVKHAEADHVILEIQWKNGLSMVIKDNGKGIPSADSITNGNGLRNMKKRTEEMKGTLEWDGSEGTVIRLWIPLTTN